MMMSQYVYSYKVHSFSPIDICLKADVKVHRLVNSLSDNGAATILDLGALIDQALFSWQSYPYDGDLVSLGKTMVRQLMMTCKRKYNCEILKEINIQLSSNTTPNTSPTDIKYDSETILNEYNCINHEVNGWGEVDILYELDHAGMYYLHIGPQKCIPLHRHTTMEETELIACDGLLCNGYSLSYGDTIIWNTIKHRYINPSQTSSKTILCIDKPKFTPTDEVPLPDEPDDQLIKPPSKKLSYWSQPWKKSTTTTTTTTTSETTNTPTSKVTKSITVKVDTCTTSTLLDMEEFTFPGGLENQVVTMRIGTKHMSGSTVNSNSVNEELKFHSVLVFAYDLNTHQLLLVQHHKRGWELPGGKLEPNETPDAAARREVLEESGAILNDVIPIGYYEIQTYDPTMTTIIDIHRKCIYVTTIQSLQDFRKQDTLSRKLTKPPPVEDIWYHNSATNEENRYSSLLCDNVYSLGLRFSQGYIHSIST